MIRTSIQTKFIVLFAGLVILMTAGISVTYYMLTKRDKQRESRQRIQIAFDIILDGFADRLQSYTRRLGDFFYKDSRLGGLIYLYRQEGGRESKRAIAVYLIKISNELKQFGHIALPDRLLVYGADKELIALYQRQADQETVGGYVASATNQPTYLAMDDVELQGKLLIDDFAIADLSLPFNAPVQYEKEFPENIHFEMFRDENAIGFRIVAPISNLGQKVGVVVSEIFYTQNIVDRYASLSQTQINLFAEDQWSIGTLPEQQQFDSRIFDQLASCDDILKRSRSIELASLRIGDGDYYQGQCSFNNAQGVIGALTVSLSQEIEQKAIMQIVKVVFLVSGIALGLGIALSVILSRRSIRAIRNIVSVITAIAEGDLRQKAVATTHDEIGMLAGKLNKMTAQLRTISTQVQDASRTVNRTANTILEQMGTLLRHMEQESASVDNATISVEKVTQFIDVVAQNTNDLLVAAAHILASIQSTRTSIDEVTASTGNLTTNLQRISSSVDQVNSSIKDISGNTGKLAEVAQRTGTEIALIDQSLKDVSSNANQSQQLAKETMEAALGGQTSVDASIQGMSDLKKVVTNTAQIIEEVNSWGEQVSAILGIVDEITEQTSLLALNASIISAQAGAHGRGFAVVADEIKELATRTKDSTKEIGTLVHSLRMKTEDGVKNINEGIQKADHGVHLAKAVKQALNAILDRATNASGRAADTAAVVQQTAESSQIISASMNTMTEMVSQIKIAIQAEEQNIEEVVTAVDNIRETAEHVNSASIEQKRSAAQIEKSMEDVTEKFSDISTQTEELKNYSKQIVDAMHTIESTTEKILVNTTDLSNNMIKNLLKESEALRKIVKIFKVS